MATITEWQRNLPTRITMSRIFMVPLIVAAMWPNTLTWNIVAAVLFMAASSTDYFDGYYARKYKAVSNFGKFMDPIADKILVTSVLAMLLALGKIDAWMVIIILARDNFIGGIRSVAAADQIIIDAKPAGKWKTAMQMIAIPIVIIGNMEPYLPYLDKIGYGVLWVSVILSITSGIEYYLGFLKNRKSA
ncbi:CDP-diacylglycerol--glycerol-3-phosphate 3-phosphatidyltransferase [Bdellovibrio svalbardensis]|uniref:CDP-diacylglycerol--glycerol-3-phosphate 3-phosphatidyltransferase n=1 Tax=Bdellovibrio svalbardensis TaxID=2972972 RepID=A0ABT6DIL3_9BACT|nr:CDP-diacylglycerol--glycerol-3-phosphate 3-phosphatidyltransferase [Bdellovibrio svalbardensis]MDG0816685.1 CDP-diacylglycerol--glycerol-3-phosphate 3-phosphatidyltransferase [Bdellovibrio svalbardensis]